MTINEKQIAKMIESELGYTNGWSIPMDDYEEHCMNVAKKIMKKIQPKTTSTDIEEVRKEFIDRFGVEIANGEDRGKRTIGSSWSRTNGSPKDIWDFFAPHLSNKSELKKEEEEK